MTNVDSWIESKLKVGCCNLVDFDCITTLEAVHIIMALAIYHINFVVANSTYLIRATANVLVNLTKLTVNRSYATKFMDLEYQNCQGLLVLTVVGTG